MPFDQLTDRRKIFKNTLTIQDQLLFHYVPLIGGNAFYLYLIYCSLAEKYNTVFPSVRSLKKQTGFSLESIVKYNKILEAAGLIEIKKIQDHNSNHYILTDPPEITEELKQKLRLHSDFTPLIKVSPLFGFPEQSSSGKPNTSIRENRTVLFGNSESIKNKDLVVNSNKTTTINTLVDAALPYCNMKAENLVVGMEVILKTALKKKPDVQQACDYIIEKVNSFSESLLKAQNPLALLHAVVKGDWQDIKAVRKQESLEFEKHLLQENDARQRRIQNAWLKLPSEAKAKYYEPGLKFDFYRKNKQWPKDVDMRHMMDELARNGRYGIFDIKSIPPDFKAEELE